MITFGGIVMSVKMALKKIRLNGIAKNVTITHFARSVENKVITKSTK
jgi:hypothetical protein